MKTQMTPAETKLTNLLKRAQQLGALDKAQGQRQAKRLPVILDAMGVKSHLGMDTKMMIHSMYHAGFNTSQALGD